MINPDIITNFNATAEGLEEVLLFWICAAGKNASTASINLDKLLDVLHGDSPFDKIGRVGAKKLPQVLKDFGIGCYNHKAKSMIELVNSNLDLRTCSLEDLMNIYGIGPKTARCFLIHSRQNARYAGLDTHVLKYLRDQGHDVPKSTPGSKKKYEEIEELFLKYVDLMDRPVAEVDLSIWLYYSRKRG